ncbi:MAG: RNA 2',3'-cyclic phosphodiesterase [Pseudomonadota bacterium]
MIRAFLGLAPPPAALDALEALQADLPLDRPVPRENFHLTLVFLGNHPRPVLEDLHLGLEAIRGAPVALHFDGLGMFGGAKPRALYARAAHCPALSHIHRKTFRAAEMAEMIPDSRKFTPHVTLSKLGAMEPGDLVELQDEMARHADWHAGPFEVDRFYLYRSTLRRGAPPVYEVLAEYPLDQ